jgi:predicted ArsR family transcriptional regulator
MQTDIPSQRFKLKARQNEILSLVAMGLVEDASDEFRDSIREQRQATGRNYKVYGLTEVGYHLFHEHEKRSVN